jgi:hypothetical protein
MMSEANPLTARVIVNRFWEQCFGNGLVRTSEDFGLQGEWPSHPELLDWLAVEFRESGWDVKHILRLITTSAVYRQASERTPLAIERDPDLRLLSSYPRRRLGAEAIRDSALHAAGLLVERVGGASVKPYQPDGLWQEVAMAQSNTRVYVQGKGEDLWRRSLYTYWKRAAPPPSLVAFDAPTREFCTIRRGTTNTPLQALVLWNDVQFVEAARVLAERVLAEVAESDDRLRLDRLCLHLLARPPDETERTLLLEGLARFRERWRNAPEDAAALVAHGEKPLRDPGTDPVEIAAWTMLASAVFNTYEATTQH